MQLRGGTKWIHRALRLLFEPLGAARAGSHVTLAALHLVAVLVAAAEVAGQSLFQLMVVLAPSVRTSSFFPRVGDVHNIFNVLSSPFFSSCGRCNTIGSERERTSTATVHVLATAPVLDESVATIALRIVGLLRMLEEEYVVVGTVCGWK